MLSDWRIGHAHNGLGIRCAERSRLLGNARLCSWLRAASQRLCVLVPGAWKLWEAALTRSKFGLQADVGRCLQAAQHAIQLSYVALAAFSSAKPAARVRQLNEEDIQ